MKLYIILSIALFAAASAFAPLSQTTKMSSTALSGWLENLFEKPLHGHGSGEDDLDEQWRMQQEILHDRRTHGIDKSHLKAKYADEENRKTFDVGGRTSDDSGSEMYVDEGRKRAAAPKKMKFPWEK